jgi:hypothetical protein
MMKKKQPREIKLGGLSAASTINFYLNPEERMPGKHEIHASYMDKNRMKAILKHCIDVCHDGKAPNSSRVVKMATAWLEQN